MISGLPIPSVVGVFSHWATLVYDRSPLWMTRSGYHRIRQAVGVISMVGLGLYLPCLSVVLVAEFMSQSRPEAILI